MLHRTSGVILGAFTLAHIINHLFALAGLAAHREVLEALRIVYRFPPAEALLLACVALQAGSGLRMAIRGWRRMRSMAQRAQLIFGLYLAFFLTVHVGAVLTARTALNLDTDFNFAAAGIQVHPFQFFFIPYYWLAIASMGVHIACALRRKTGTAPAVAISIAGASVAFLVVATMSGAFYRIDIPLRYPAPFNGV